jgi:hypothetical protein
VLGCAVGTAGFALWAWKITDLSLNAQWPYVVIAGAGLGLLLGPASTDAVNRAIGASYGEVTGITQTVRNYASALGIAVLGTALTTVLTHRLTTSFTGLGLPASAAEAAANGSVGQSSGGVPASVPARLREAIQSAVATDFAVATRAVLIGMATALGAAFLVSLAHPGRRAPAAPTSPAAEQAAEEPAA